MSLDQRRDVACHELDLPSLVAQRPEVDALASRVRLAGEDGGAVLRGADAELLPQPVLVSIQKRRHDVDVGRRG